MSIGERAVSTYIRHPPAGVSLFANGFGLDAGTVMLLLDNNPAVLEREYARTLVFSRGPSNAALYVFSGNTSPVDGLSDGGTTTNNFTQAYDPIAWDRRTAVRHGPFYGVIDRNLSTGRQSFRSVRCRSQYTIDASGNTTQAALFAMTQDPDPHAIFLGGHLASGSVVIAGTGKQTATADLSPTITAPGFVSETLRCRRLAPNGDQVSVSIYPFWIWFGHHFVNAAARNNYLDCMTAYEIR
jgi:hypothetical protein